MEIFYTDNSRAAIPGTRPIMGPEYNQYWLGSSYTGGREATVVRDHAVSFLDPNTPSMVGFEYLGSNTSHSHIASPLSIVHQLAIKERADSLLTPPEATLLPEQRDLLEALLHGTTVGAYAKENDLNGAKRHKLTTGTRSALNDAPDLLSAAYVAAMFQLATPPAAGEKNELSPWRETPNQWLHVYLGSVGLDAADAAELGECSKGRVSTCRQAGKDYFRAHSLHEAIGQLFAHEIYRPFSEDEIVYLKALRAA